MQRRPECVYLSATPCGALLLAAMWLQAFSAPSVWAVDLRFGADGLPYLARRASLIVLADRVRDLPPEESSRVALYEVTWSRVLAGDPGVEEITIALPKALDVAGAAAIERALLFLRPPMSEDDLRFWQVAADGPVREVVSGRFGVVPVDGGDQILAAVESYLAADDAPARLSWAEQYATSAHTFLQSSAVLEAMAPGQSLAEDRVQRLLEGSLTAESVNLEVKRIGLQLLVSSESPRAFETLRSVAEESAEDPRLRVHALDAIDTLVEGADQMREWELKGDEVLGPAAVRALERKIEREKEILGPTASSAGLSPGSGLAGHRGLPLVDLEAIVQGLVDPQTGGLAERVEWTEGIGQLGSVEARELLRRLLTEPKADPALLGAAIRGLTETERSRLPDGLDSIPHDLFIENLESVAEAQRLKLGGENQP